MPSDYEKPQIQNPANDYCQTTGKRRYPSQSEASKANRGIHRRGWKSNRSVTPYLCRACGEWHLGREKT